MIYLDTHVLIWLYLPAPDLLSDTAKRQIDENELLISPIVLLELEYLREVGRLEVDSQSVYRFLHTRLGLQLCAEPFASVIEGAASQSWTRDPFDRVIVGQAAVRGLPLLTRDRTIWDQYEHAIWK